MAFFVATRAGGFELSTYALYESARLTITPRQQICDNSQQSDTVRPSTSSVGILQLTKRRILLVDAIRPIFKVDVPSRKMIENPGSNKSQHDLIERRPIFKETR